MRGRAASHPQGVDTVFGLVVVCGTLFAVRFGPSGRTLGVEDLVTGSLACALIATRRRWPLPVFCVVTVVSAAFNLHAALVALLATSVICTYTVASRTSRRVAVVTGAITILTV